MLPKYPKTPKPPSLPGVAHTMKPMVMVGTQVYPMKRTPLVTNRWDTLVPVPADASELRYRIKVNWEYNAVPVPDANSQRSEFLDPDG